MIIRPYKEPVVNREAKAGFLRDYHYLFIHYNKIRRMMKGLVDDFVVGVAGEPFPVGFWVARQAVFAYKGVWDMYLTPMMRKITSDGLPMKTTAGRSSWKPA